MTNWIKITSATVRGITVKVGDTVVGKAAGDYHGGTITEIVRDRYTGIVNLTLLTSKGSVCIDADRCWKE